MNKLIGLLIFVAFIFTSNAVREWALLSSVNLSNQQRMMMQHRHSIVFKKQLPLKATQILFSWNCARPPKGYFAFYMQVHDATTNMWSDWYKVAEWGATVQRSFERNLSNAASFFYVRWQLPKKHVADSCRIRVDTHGGASLALVYRLALAAVNYELFISERNLGKRFSLSSVFIKDIPVVSQIEVDHNDRNRICSPTSLSMVVSYLNRCYEAPEQFIGGVYDYGLQTYGSWPFNIAHAFDRCKGKFYFAVTRLNSFVQLHNYLQHNLPVVVSIRGRLKTMPFGKTYEDGHLLVVVGWDNKRKQVICCDPAFSTKKQVLHRYDIDEFLKAWERSARLSYVIEPRS